MLILTSAGWVVWEVDESETEMRLGDKPREILSAQIKLDSRYLCSVVPGARDWLSKLTPTFPPGDPPHFKQERLPSMFPFRNVNSPQRRSNWMVLGLCFCDHIIVPAILTLCNIIDLTFPFLFFCDLFARATWAPQHRSQPLRPSPRRDMQILKSQSVFVDVYVVLRLYDQSSRKPEIRN